MNQSVTEEKNDEIDPSKPRRTYLITYSQADTEIFPARESFSAAVVQAFTKSNCKAKPMHWACALENHANEGKHYHLALKLTAPKRWLDSKTELYETKGISVHFSEHENYYSTYKYVCKTDNEVFLSEGHPNLDELGSPRTKSCHKSYAKKRASASNGDNTSSKKKKVSLSNSDVSDFIIKNNIKNEINLLAVAKIQKDEGKKDLADFILRRNSKTIQELIKQSWKMENACLAIEREKMNHLDLIKKADGKPCALKVNGTWLKLAEEVLINNKEHPIIFAAALRD